VLGAPLALRISVRLAEGEAVTEKWKALAAALSDCLAMALAQKLALERPVAQMPSSPLTSCGQPEALLRSEFVVASLPEGMLRSDWVTHLDSVAMAKEVTEAELEVVTEALSDELDVTLAKEVLLSLPLPILEAEPVPHWVALTLAVPAAESELTEL
jgi:hypothetical protein